MYLAIGSEFGPRALGLRSAGVLKPLPKWGMMLITASYSEYLRRTWLLLAFLRGYGSRSSRIDVGCEVQLLERPSLEASSAALAAQLLGRDTRPSVAAVRAERQRRLQEALNAMDPLDREVLVLRHFAELTSTEVARELGLQESAASKRYIRALRKLKEILGALPGGIEDFR
jgi:RNA polymerase sigma factor (sigma-70 family)